ncbi:MAG: glycosyltransferase family 4 protein [Alphaproteobacteria bacterium]|nr:MAG: glycosyltransferase family 4 protein [Alphaproteobacteria bacterium]
MRILLFSQLFPNARQPYHGIFVENRLRHLLAMSGYEARVLAPLPWAPPLVGRLARYRAYRGVPRSEERHGIRIDHPRYVVIPKIGMNVAPFLLYAAARRALRRMHAEGERFDLLDAHYFYPDGVAAAMLAREFDLPFVVTGRGTDLNLIPRYPVPRALIRRAAARASGLITVCAALADDLAALGIPRERVTVLRNGVDLETFHHDAEGAAALRDRLRLEPPVLASVGLLIARKAHHLVIDALARLGKGSLLIAGKGEEEARLRAHAAALGVGERVHFLGGVPHDELRTVYSAADLLVLASSREGWPNVLLEALACGTPVVATAVNGSPEVVREAVAGEIVAERTGAALAAAARRVLDRGASRAAVRAYAEAFSWDETSRGQMQLFERIVKERR